MTTAKIRTHQVPLSPPSGRGTLTMCSAYIGFPSDAKKLVTTASFILSSKTSTTNYFSNRKHSFSAGPQEPRISLHDVTPTCVCTCKHSAYNNHSRAALAGQLFARANSHPRARNLDGAPPTDKHARAVCTCKLRRSLLSPEFARANDQPTGQAIAHPRSSECLHVQTASYLPPCVCTCKHSAYSDHSGTVLAGQLFAHANRHTQTRNIDGAFPASEHAKTVCTCKHRGAASYGKHLQWNWLFARSNALARAARPCLHVQTISTPCRRSLLCTHKGVGCLCAQTDIRKQAIPSAGAGVCTCRHSEGRSIPTFTRANVGRSSATTASQGGDVCLHVQTPGQVSGRRHSLGMRVVARANRLLSFVLHKPEVMREARFINHQEPEVKAMT